MKKINLHCLKINDQNIFQFSSRLERYLFPLEIADEVFCNYIVPKAYRSFYGEVLNFFDENFSKYVSERNEINSIRYDLSKYIENLKPDGKKITEDSFKLKVNWFTTTFNYCIESCCSILTSLGERLDKEDYSLDEKDIVRTCMKYGEAEIFKIQKNQQEKIIEFCSKDVAKYFCYLCIAEELVEMEGEDLDSGIRKEIAETKYDWEFSTLLSIPHSNSFIDSSLDRIYSFYKEACRKNEVPPREEDSFRGCYPKCSQDIFKYRMPIKFYNGVYKYLSDKERRELLSLSMRAYLDGDSKELLNRFTGYEDDFGNTRVDYNIIKQVFYFFLVNGLYPSAFYFECFFDKENNILMKEKFFEDRCGKDFLSCKSVGRFFDIYDYHKAFDSEDEQKEIIDDDDDFFVDADELFRCLNRLSSLIAEYANKEYIPSCDISRLTQAVLDIKKNIEGEKNNNKISYQSFLKYKDALARMEDENRIAFLNYKNKFSDEKTTFSDSTDKEVFEDDIDSKIAEICESSYAFDEEIFDSSGNEVSNGMESKKKGVKKIINEKYLSDLRRIRSFVNNNSSDQELALLIKDAERVLDIAANGYRHDECSQNSFDWFENTVPSVLDSIDYFSKTNKIPSSYELS